MRNDHYPEGTVRALLQTDFVTENTRAVLINRLEKQETVTPLFFNDTAFATLRSVCARLIPQPNRSQKIDIAGMLDEQLAAGKGNGWRYDQMPPDKEAYTLGLQGVDETAVLMFGNAFILLTAEDQDDVLKAVQSGSVEGKVWEQLPANLFFEELLASIVEIYYSHPLAKEEIGEVAFADAKGWQKTGLNEQEQWEPLAIKIAGNE